MSREITPDRWSRIQSLYHAALERPESQRDSFLRDACGDDESLLKEVRSLLRFATPAEADPNVIGQAVSHYTVIDKIGEGGMGVVYKAKDVILERTVALKFLTVRAIQNSERKTRFIREAKAAAALDHPNVCTVYEIGEAGDRIFIAMALIEGECVADKIARRPLKLGEALDIAIQTAQGLQATHEKGIVHRDIKTTNLMVNVQGQVKIMDFGVAQLADHTRITESTVIVGTPAYLSPEQAQRRPTDHRCDIWSLGIVLYEMTAGRLPFEGDHSHALLYSIIHHAHEPVTALRVGIPPELDRIIAKALAKNPDERYQHIDELLVDLRNLARYVQSDARLISTVFAGSTTAPVSNVFQNTLRERRLKVAVLGLAVLSMISFAFITVLLLREDTPSPDEPVRRFSIPFEEARPVIAPNGRHIAYRSGGRLWIRDLNSETPREIPGGATTGAYYEPAGYYLTWSLDSRYIVFPAENELRRVSVDEGGSATTICKLPSVPKPGLRALAGMAFTKDGQTIVFSSHGTGIYEVPAHGGAPKLVWEEEHADDLVVLDTPTGRAVVFASLKGDGSEVGHSLVVRTPDGERRSITNLGTSWPEMIYSPTGHILYRKDPADDASIWALPFSAETLRAEGEPFLVERSGRGVSLSGDGTLIYLDMGRSRQILTWRDRQGKTISRAMEGHQVIDHVSLSPDGNRAIVTAIDDGPPTYWLYDVRRFVKTRFTLGSEAEGGTPMAAFWVRPGNEIYYTLLRKSPQVGTDVFAKPADGLQQARQIPLPEGFKVVQDSTTDGRSLLMSFGNPLNIWLWRKEALGDKGEVVHFSQNSEREAGIVLSPNERYIAYASTIGGRNEVYVRRFPEGQERWQISEHGGEAPIWGPGGSELFFAANNTLFRVRVSTVGEFSAGTPQPVFEQPGLVIRQGPAARYAVSPDGKRFLVVESERESTTPVMRVVENWLSEFRRAMERPR